MTPLTTHQDQPTLPRQRQAPATPATATPATATPALTAPAHTPTTPTPTPPLTTTVPRQYVHRASHAEVFLTSGQRLTDNHFHLTAQWPRTHTFFTTHPTHHDPLQAAETIRQAGLYLAHTQFNVPLDHHFLLWELNITTHPHPTPHTTHHPRQHPTELTLDATTPHTTH
ncbi:AfsA-related hotdog domain-containing protein, partial [Streptomyces sp. NPDC006284]|uniref:AfsA-related hotdog domain-containing protein n=1 Tax=Streptomyces sp. NPDC006284 TaxID=3156742 RepID=UPI0033ACEA53